MNRLTILVDNFEFEEGLRKDWGFSAVVDDGCCRVLFDLGADPNVFSHNVEKLGVDLSGVDCLVISHSDHDHVGDLGIFLKANSKAKVFVPKGFDGSLAERILRSGHELVIVEKPLRVCGIFHSTGPVEPSPRPEHSLFFKTSRGYWILAGCSHPGVHNVAKAVKDHTGGEIDLYIGGYHLYRMNAEEIREFVERVRAVGVKRVAPCHCSGHEARREFGRLFGDDYVEVGVGSSLGFET